ncbi:MAG TPA: ribosome maturation factor RimM [Gammaproteobacteria bacterium]|nr:ribosome maturation factor RimM [Gammaproteobacteria bacterium]
MAGAAKDDSSREWVTVGTINGLYGVHGAVRLYSYMDDPAAILAFDRLWLVQDGQRQERRLTERERKGPRLVARLEGIEGRDQARALLGVALQVPRDALGQPEDDAFFWTDLVGLAVTTLDGVALGEVIDLLETGANDVLVVAGADRERLIPFTAEAVPEVDLERGQIRVDWDPDF